MKKAGILIVDDHPATIHGLAQFIATTHDLEVCAEAVNMQEAIQAATDKNPDIAIVDISLKEGKTAGLDLIKDLKKIDKSISVLVVSMHDEMLYAERALQCGAKGFLMKQEPVREILKAIRIIKDGGIYLSQRMSDLLLLRTAGNDTEPDKDKLVGSLSNREFEIFDYIGHGIPTKTIAEKLHISTKTVESHKITIRKKLKINSSPELSQYAIAWIHKNV